MNSLEVSIVPAVAFTVKVYVPDAEGLPVKVPVNEFSVSHEGRLDDDQTICELLFETSAVNVSV